LSNDVKDKSGQEHVLHAIFIKSNNGVNYEGVNSWGDHWPEILIPVNKFDEAREVQV